MIRWVAISGFVLATVAAAFGNRSAEPRIEVDHPAIQYYTRKLNDPAARLNTRIQYGEVHLKSQGPQGYLRAVLDALNVPIDSQLVVFSKTSFQSERITPKNPRSLFFNDSVIVGWVRGGPVIEVAAEDPKQGMVFYKLSQSASSLAHLDRDLNCVMCHQSNFTRGVPGTLMRSVYPGQDGSPVPELGDYLTDDRSPFAQRWGGWYVTGATGSAHMGNSVAREGALRPMAPGKGQTLESLKGLFDTDAYLSPYSDVVALMVFEHEMHVMNLFTRMGWDVRLADYQDESNESRQNRRETERILQDRSRELVDYMLFVDEAPLAAKVEGTSGFAEEFSKRGPTDSEGRSLRQFDLEHRLMRYPCSYMIYSDAFDGLPDEAQDAIYQRMWKILSGQEKERKYQRLTLADRQAIVDILRDTKRRLPDYFQGVVR